MIVTLTGTITQHTDFGPPNFGEDPAHDEKQRYWRPDLDNPICVNGKNEDSPDMDGESDVRNLQIVYLKGYPQGGDWAGHRASVTGTLFHAYNGHHHTTVLILAAKTTEVP